MTRSWPAYMRKDTVMEYLDIRSETDWTRCTKGWPGFPQKDPATKRWLKKEIDIWLDRRHHLTGNTVNDMDAIIRAANG